MKFWHYIIVVIMILLAGWGITLQVQATSPYARPNVRFTLDRLEAYRHYNELNDQLYLVRFSNTYTTNTTPDLDAGQTFIVRLLLNGVEIAAVVPYAYYNDGYAAEQVASFYFTASDAPAWSGNISYQLTANPTLSWSESPLPSITSAVVNKWSTSTTVSDTSTELTARIRVIATDLETSWSLDMIENVSGVNKLTSYGETYFETTISGLRDACPDLFESTVTNPSPYSRDSDTTYATERENLLVGTPFDMTDLAAMLGISRMWATSVLWFALCLLISSGVVWKLQATRVALFLFGGLMIFGSVTGFMAFEASILIGFVGLLAIIYAIFWRGAD